MANHVLTKKKTHHLNINLILIVLVGVIAIAPLILMKGAEFVGTDDRAEVAISELDADYKPWFSSPFEPLSAERESLLFGLQAAMGAGVLGFGLIYLKRRNRSKDLEKEND